MHAWIHDTAISPEGKQFKSTKKEENRNPYLSPIISWQLSASGPPDTKLCCFDHLHTEAKNFRKLIKTEHF